MNTNPYYNNSFFGITKEQYDEYTLLKKEHDKQQQEEDTEVKSKEELQLEIELEECKIKNEILIDKVYEYTKTIFDLQLRLKLVNDKLDEVMKKYEASRIVNTSKIIDN